MLLVADGRLSEADDDIRISLSIYIGWMKINGLTPTKQTVDLKQMLMHCHLRKRNNVTLNNECSQNN